MLRIDAAELPIFVAFKQIIAQPISNSASAAPTDLRLRIRGLKRLKVSSLPQTVIYLHAYNLRSDSRFRETAM